MTKQVTQYGITWTFDKEYEVGQFVNGDYWVVGPVKVVSIIPNKRGAIEDELNGTGDNYWGNSGLKNDTTVRNGSVVVDSLRGSKQGFDSRGLGFDSSLPITLPYKLASNSSIVSSTSNDTIPQQVVYHHLMWKAEKKQASVIKTVAILTCLPIAPPVDAFRPSYVGSEKKIFKLSDVDFDKLLDLEPTENMPSWEQFEQYFQRAWLNHFNGSWLGQELLPTNMNQPYYGREYARIVGQASLMLNTDATDEQKKKLLIGMLQLGIDLRGIAEIGGTWVAGGGLTSGRKWPILFAYLMFDDPYFKDMPNTANFHEDTETYYGKGWAGQAALWKIVRHHGVRKTYLEQTPDKWENWDYDKETETYWGTSSENYRLCCNTEGWVGQCLSALLMEGKSAWNHNALFDNVEDWMREKDIYADNRGESFPRPSQEGQASYFGFNSFVTEMWIKYRSQVPSQADGLDNLQWSVKSVTTKYDISWEWVDNEILKSIENQDVKVGETLQLEILTILTDSKVNISLTDNNLPTFCTLIDKGNGSGILTILPTKDDTGEYLINISAKSKSFTNSKQSFTLNIK